jgi:glycosyltransferase involved in cell wall biosynthesis
MHSFDVVVPCYNYGQYLPDCITSILNQEGCLLRVLIIDDASHDGSADVAYSLAAKDSRINLIVHPKNIGSISTYNEGIAWAQQKYFLLISADDALAPGALKRAGNLLAANPNVAFVYGRAIGFRGEMPALANISALTRRRIVPGRQFIAKICANPNNPVATLTAVVRTSVQKSVGLYKSELPHAGDLEMWLRCAASGDVGEIDSVQGFRRFHDRNMSSFYMAGGFMIRDFKQRADTFRIFFAEHGRDLKDGKQLLKSANRGLAQQIIDHAKVEFRRKRVQSALRLLGLASRLDTIMFITKSCLFIPRLFWRQVRRHSNIAGSCVLAVTLIKTDMPFVGV